MIKFEVGKTYTMRSMCDLNATWSYLVVMRSNQFVFLRDASAPFSNQKRCKVRQSIGHDAEICNPLGFYSMAPILSAEKVQS